EDNEINQMVTEEILRSAGYDCDIVASGVQALEALKRGGYALVLMDCQMPVMDGFEATRALRAREVGARHHQIVIALTANASAEDREACRRAGMDDFLSKPFQRSELAGMLQHSAALAPASERVVDVVALVSAGASVDTAPIAAPVRQVAPAAEAPPPPRAPEPPTVSPRRFPSTRAPNVLARRQTIAPSPVAPTPPAPAALTPVASQVQAIVDAATAADAAQLARAAHDLKGGSGNLGLLQIADLLARLEQLAKRNQLADVPPLLSQLANVHAVAAAAVRGELARCTPTPEADHA
ncbi:MAG: response regulator, partial [Deltaproteobacteria bacterium]|nr:response regulator [Deltaproteobacteria bacterium]